MFRVWVHLVPAWEEYLSPVPRLRCCLFLCCGLSHKPRNNFVTWVWWLCCSCGWGVLSARPSGRQSRCAASRQARRSSGRSSASRPCSWLKSCASHRWPGQTASAFEATADRSRSVTHLPTRIAPAVWLGVGVESAWPGASQGPWRSRADRPPHQCPRNSFTVPQPLSRALG